MVPPLSNPRGVLAKPFRSVLLDRPSPVLDNSFIIIRYPAMLYQLPNAQSVKAEQGVLGETFFVLREALTNLFNKSLLRCLNDVLRYKASER